MFSKVDGNLGYLDLKSDSILAKVMHDDLRNLCGREANGEYRYPPHGGIDTSLKSCALSK